MANRITNAIRVLFNQEPSVVEKNENIDTKINNGINPLSSDYFNRGGWKANVNFQTEKDKNNQSLYNGYLFSALELRRNSFAEFAEENIITKTERESIVDPYHPYLKLIEESKNSTEYEFWQDLITDWDMKGEFFIFLLRRVVYKRNAEGKNILDHIGKPTAIEILDANKMTTLRNSIGEVVGYEEWIDTTHKRVFAPEQIIHIWNKNPFNKKSPYSIFDAAKDYQFTLNKGTDFTQAALANNGNTPGILSTDQILNDSEYDNLVSRINNHEPGRVIVSDGAGKLSYTPISQQLDGTALSGVTDVSRQVIFAVTGTSKTMLGIEESGTTRETARIQYNKFIQRTITPIVKRVVSALNFDFRQYYPETYNSEKIEMTIKDDSDPATTKESYEVQKMLFDSVLEMTYSGYTSASAERFMNGEIPFTELELDGEDAMAIDDKALGTDQIESTEDLNKDDNVESDQDMTGEETETGAEIETENEEGKFLPKVKPIDLQDVIQQTNTEDISNLSSNCHHHEESLEDWIDNVLLRDHKVDNSTEYGQLVSSKLKGAYRNMVKDFRALDLEMIEESELVTNKLSLKDIRSGKVAKEMKEKLINIVLKYMRNIMSTISAERKALDKDEWQLTGNINVLGEKEVNEEMYQMAELIADSHVHTIYDDLLKNTEKEKKKAAKKKMQLTAALLTLALQRTMRRSTKQRVPVLAENVFLHAIGLGEYWTDLLLVRQNGLSGVAFKILRTNYSDPCDHCKELLNKPIPLTQNFANVGSHIGGGDKPMLVTMFPVRTNLVHVNCRCQYQLIIQNRKKKDEDEEKLGDLPYNPLSIIGDK